MSQPSQWQQRIAGEWHGRPSLFDADGTWRGYEDIRRSSVFEDGVTTYYMDGGLEGGGPLAGRFRLGAPFAFGVLDSDADRIYTGPDFYGTGQPYGTFVDAHYYGPGWQVDLNTWNQVLGDDTQVYSSMLFQGPAVVGCFNGVYKRGVDGDALAAHLAAETRNGPVPFILPTKRTGVYSGRCELWGADQKLIGPVDVELALTPVDLLHTRLDVRWTGSLDRSYTVQWRRDGFRSFYEGPGAWGNAIAFGRANYATVHSTDVMKVTSREFMLDATPGMAAGTALAVAYRIHDGATLAGVLHGELRWSAA